VLVELARGDLKSAATVANRGVELTRARAGAESADHAMALKDRGLVAVARGDFEHGLKDLEAAIAGLVKANNAEAQLLVEPLIASANAQLGLQRHAEAIALAERGLAITEKRCAYPGQQAALRFTLARALLGSGGDRRRAAQLATQALDEWRRLPWLTPRADEAEAFLKARHLLSAR
jgi:eukaryotic-like serine/threonine-protein kinase